MSEDCAGQVIPEIFLVIFHTYVNLEILLVHFHSGNNMLFHEMFLNSWYQICIQNLCILRDINITFYWFQSSHAVIRFAVENCERPLALPKNSANQI